MPTDPKTMVPHQLEAKPNGTKTQTAETPETTGPTTGGATTGSLTALLSIFLTNRRRPIRHPAPTINERKQLVQDSLILRG